MYTVEELIGNLLLRHNCVIIPTFGGFVAKQSSATIDYKNGVMLPPKKSVLFNRQLVNSDGLLVSEYASTNRVLYPVAEESVLNNVAEWNEKLRNGERITLDRVGYLFYDQEKNICFEQDRFFNLLLESYGLGKVHFVTEEDIKISQHVSAVAAQKIEVTPEIEQPTFKLVSLPIIEEEEKVVVSEKEFVLVEHPAVKSPSKAWKYIAAAILLPVGFYSFWLPMKTNILESGVLSINDFNPAYKALEGTYKKEEFGKIKFVTESEPSLEKNISSLPGDVHTYSYAFDEDTYLPVRISNEVKEEKQTVVEEAAVEIEAPVVEKVIEPKKTAKVLVEKQEKVVITATVKKTAKPAFVETKQKNFDFIVGSFSTEEHAQLMIEKLKSKGLSAYLIQDNSSINRVSAGSASTTEEISSIAEKTRAIGIDGWILKK